KYFPRAVDAVLAAQAKRDARFVVFDIRNLEFFGKSFLGSCVTLWKQLRQVRCQFVVICDEEYLELFTILHLDKVITVLAKEGESQKLVAASAEPTPFQPAILDPAGRTPTVTALATAAYEERPLPAVTLDPDRLAVLADALEDAGCDNADILSHLRGPG